LIPLGKFPSIEMVLVWVWLFISFLCLGPLNLLAYVPIVEEDDFEELYDDEPSVDQALKETNSDSDIEVSPTAV
jgi:hypothetical protein